MAFNLNEALEKIGAPEYSGIEGLTRLVNETSAVAANAAPNAVTLLYSGDLSNGIHNWQVANTISAASTLENSCKLVVTIDDTDIAKLLKNQQFKDALLQACNGDQIQFNLILSGTDSSDTRVATGLWDEASRNFVSSATGDVRTIVAPSASSSSVFSQTELKALLDTEASPNVTHINGIPREDLIRLRSDLLATGTTTTPADIAEANRVLLDYVKHNSAEQIAELKVSLGNDGKTITGVGTKEFFEKIGLPGSGTDLPSGHTGVSATSLMSVTQTPEQLSNAKLANSQLIQYGQERYNLAKVADDTALMAKAGHYLNKLGTAGDILALALVATAANAAYEKGDTEGAKQIIKDWALDFGGGLAGGLLAAKLVGSALLPLYLTGPAGAIIAGGLTLLAGLLGGLIGGEVAVELGKLFTTSQAAIQPRRDPLTLDLDNDGLETIGINTANPILFDHDGDGVKTATGWVKADDAFLVMDRNGNGTIDNGAELFGDSTPLAGGGTATDGFAALAQEDTNADGLVNANDARFANLRVWRDLNQDGVSQSNELQTLQQAGIAAIKVAKTENSQLLSNGNQLADLGTFIRTDGSTGGLGEVTAQMGDINLDVTTDGAYSRFADNYADILGRIDILRHDKRKNSLIA